MTTFGADNRETSTNALAVVGFIALVGAGIYLAVYSTRFVPSVVGGIGSAAVYIGSVFSHGPDATLSVVPNASSTPVTEASSTPVASSVGGTQAVTPTAGPETSGAYAIDGATTTPVVTTGLPDFIATIDSIGYLATSSADSFVASSTVPAGDRPAVRFTIKNVGGTATGLWRFSASIPTQTAYLYQSQQQQTLGPGDSIQYTLGFDQANRGANQMISVTANYDRGVNESNFNNDSASATLTILGN